MWEEAEASVRPSVCERPGGCPGSQGKPGSGFRRGARAGDSNVKGLSREGKRGHWGVLGVMPQKEVSGEAGRR